MKNLNTLLIAISIFTFSTKSFSQRMTVKGGLNLSNMEFKYGGESYSEDFKMNPGINLGITSEFKIAKPLAIETGLIFSSKGFKLVDEYKDMDHSMKEKINFNLYYIDVPLNLKGSFNLGKMKVYGTAGPYLGVGLIGIIKYQETYNNKTETDREIIEFGEDGIKRLDYGLNAGLGIEIKAIQIGANYGWGLANLDGDSYSSSQIKNRVLSFTVGYKFGKKKTEAKS